MKKIIALTAIFSMFFMNCYAGWGISTATSLQTSTVSAAVETIENSLKALDGTSDDPPTNIVAKNLKLNGATSGTVTLTPAATAGTTAITVPAVAGTLVTTAGAGADIDIGTYSLTANTLVSDVATGTAPMTISSTTVVTNLNADLLDGSHASTTTGSAVIPIADASGYLPDNSVDTTALKTTTGEVSRTTSGQSTVVLPGGEYGFYPQLKAEAGNHYNVTFCGEFNYDDNPGSTSYLTVIWLRSEDGSDIYAQQRYVTASGQDLWIFLLIDKITKDIVSAYSAPDHPAYGNGGDFNKVPHPFGDYDPTKHEIVLLDKDTSLALKTESEQTGKSILTLVNEEYKVNAKDEVYQPLHSGKFIDKKPELVQTIPDYIKVRKLVKLTQGEKSLKEINKQQKALQKEEDRVKFNENKNKLINKLKDLGLTKDEVEVFIK